MREWRRRHSLTFKRRAVEKMKTSNNIRRLARELEVGHKLLYSWKDQFAGLPEKNRANYAENPPPETVETQLRREIKELKELLGGKAAEVDFFAAALRRVNLDCQSKQATGAPASTPKSGRRPLRKAN